MRTIGQTVRLLRLEKGLSQQALADILKVSSSTIGMWENDERSPNEDVKEHIADYFNVDMNFLYGKTNIRNSYREFEELGLDTTFGSAQEAMEFILSQPMIMAFGGYDFDKMSDDQKIQFANKILKLIRLEAEGLTEDADLNSDDF